MGGTKRSLQEKKTNETKILPIFNPHEKKMRGAPHHNESGV